DAFLWFDCDGAVARQTHQSGRRSLWLRQKLSFSVMHNHFRIITRLTKTAGKLRRLDDRPLRDLFARRISHNDVRSRIVPRMHPEIIRLGDAKSEIVIVACGASDKNLVTVS